MSNTTKPKLRKIVLAQKEAKGILGERKEGPVTLRFKPHPAYSYYSYGYRYNSGPNKTIQVDLDAGTIQAEVIAKSMSKTDFDKFLKWAKDNTVWQDLSVRCLLSYKNEEKKLTDLVAPDISKDDIQYQIRGKVLVNLKPTQAAAIQNVLDARKADQAKKRAKAAVERKAAKERDRKILLRDSALENSDLAVALEILKKNGLKIVTVDSKGK